MNYEYKSSRSSRDINYGISYTKPSKNGEVAEWLKAHAWKVCIR